MDIKGKKIKRILFCVICFILFLGNLIGIRKISSIDYTNYQVKGPNGHYELADGKTVKCDFIAVDENIIQINIPIEFNKTGNVGGCVSIVNDNNQIIFNKDYFYENVQIGTEWMHQCDVSQLSFEKGKKYTFTMQISEKDSIKVWRYDTPNMALIQVCKFKYKGILIGAVCVFDIFFIVLLYFLRKSNGNNKWWFCLALVSGIGLSIIMVPYSQADEYRHFLRIYDIANGNLSDSLSDYNDEITGNVIPTASNQVCTIEIPSWIENMKYIDTDFNYLGQSYENECNNHGNIEKFFELFEKNEQTYNAALTAVNNISIFAYLPQVIFVYIAMLLGCKGIGLYYLARIGGVVVCSILFYICLQIGDRYKNLICTLYFIPNIMLLRSSCSTDGLLNVLVILTVTWILYNMDKKHVLNITFWIVLLIMLSYIAVIKLPYVLIGFLLLIVDKKYFVTTDNKPAKLIKWVMMIGTMFFSATIYKCVNLFVNYNYFKSYKGIPDTTKLIGGAHIAYIVNNPVKVLILFIKELYGHLVRQYPDIMGQNYNGYYKYVYGIFILLIAIFSMKFLSNKHKIISGSIFIVGCLTILLVGFTWLAPDIGYIYGISGRYFIPFIYFLMLTLSFGSEQSEECVEKIVPIFILSGIGVMNITCLISNWG